MNTTKVIFLIASILFTINSKTPLPKEPLIISYLTHDTEESKVLNAVKTGSNVIVWFAIDLIEKDSKPYINHPLLKLQTIGNTIDQINRINPKVVHLVCIGGWNAPHISQFPSKLWIETLTKWNTSLKDYGFSFDGFDYDIEGNDDPQSQYSSFTLQNLQLMKDLAKGLHDEGFLMTMAPAQSYLDYKEDDFSLRLNFDPAWRSGFPYSGRNAYAYILKDNIESFDFVSIQLYEGYSRAFNSIVSEGVNVGEYFKDLVKGYSNGWVVRFSREVGAGEDSVIEIPKEKLVIGLANGWADRKKFMYLYKGELKDMVDSLKKEGLMPRGFMYWLLNAEGSRVYDPQEGEEIEYYMTWMLREYIYAD